MISVVISMLDEIDTVNKTIAEIRRVFKDAFIAVEQSGEFQTPTGADSLHRHENLAGIVEQYEVAARSICRNYSNGFNSLPEENNELVVAATGDTLIKDATTISRIFAYMMVEKKFLACSQAIGQNFHSVDSDPKNGRCGGRFQFPGISDFMPQFWILDGGFFQKTNGFKSIAVTNPYTSEQCLGDEFMRYITGRFRDCAYVLSDNAYQFADGVEYHRR